MNRQRIAICTSEIFMYDKKLFHKIEPSFTILCVLFLDLLLNYLMTAARIVALIKIIKCAFKIIRNT